MKPPSIRTIGNAVVLSVFLLCYVVSFASDQVAVGVRNATRFYLHVVINNKPYLYVAPGGSVNTESGFSALVEVFYSPGQGITGRGQRELSSTVNVETTESTGCTNDQNNDCESTRSSSRSASPLSWTVTPDDLSPE